MYTNRNHWNSFFNFTSTKPVQFSSAIILDDNFWIFFFTVNRKKLWINTICIILVYLVTAHNLCIARPYYPANTIKLCDANSYRWTLIEMLRNFNKLFIRSISNFKEKNSQVVILLYTPYTIKYIQFKPFFYPWASFTWNKVHNFKTGAFPVFFIKFFFSKK